MRTDTVVGMAVSNLVGLTCPRLFGTTLAPTHEGHFDLPAHRYLGIEVDDALAIAEQVDV